MTADEKAFLDQVAASIQRRGFRLPALIALQIGHPLTFLGGQLVWVAQPALSLFMSTQTIRQVAQLLEKPAAVQALIDRLETNEG
ncbi:MAG: hypothetical protein KC413_11020 [Anaerolineales bacterium]|nr:hypothetical protein [Anaerolineales bacterium]MCA9976276.1 hypothetical protein [Anaerolineales bacterium]MCB8966304.1 hypothetical protein [Ardenticatenaceae bacterium]